MRSRNLLLVVLALLFAAASSGMSQKDREKLEREESEDYFKKWLNQDVVYIITDEERAVFETLTTSVEKENFIEQFWRRRDPDSTTQYNEYKEEFYRRIAYANDHFSVGVPGWKSDRGRIYIVNGPPDSIEHHDQGEQYYRPQGEGGGVTTTYAWELWYYRYLPEIGDGIEVEFVDKSMTGHYVLARDEMDKDAMLWIPGLGLTEAERLGGASKSERIGTRTMANVASRRVGNPLKNFTQKDDLFARLRRYAKLQAAPHIKFKDLEGLVDIKLYYDKLPFRVRHDLIRVTANDFLAPVTFYFDAREFTYKSSGSTRQATLNVFGRVESLAKRTVYSFDDTVYLTLSPRREERVSSSIYQRSIPLAPGRYKLVAIVKDVESGKIGTLEHGIVIPADTGTDLQLSPIILADRVQPASNEEFITDPFVLAGVKVYPNASNRFSRGHPLGFYFEAYNVTADQQTLKADLSLEIQILRDGQEVATPFQGKDLRQLLHRFSDRFFAGSMLNTQPLTPGRYDLNVSLADKVAGTIAQRKVDFEVLAVEPETN
ncbi:MAG: GWxTD domain-containing protein [Acidobacteriota bacterium]